MNIKCMIDVKDQLLRLRIEHVDLGVKLMLSLRSCKYDLPKMLFVNDVSKTKIY